MSGSVQRKRVLALVMNPGGILESRLAGKAWPWALIVSGTAFFL